MSFWSKAGLLVAGAAAGYLASKRGGDVIHAAQELVVRDPMQVDKRENGRGSVEKFFSSTAMAPVRRGALRAVKFAATVKQGMTEREEQLNRQYARQKTDIRPGSLDTWDHEDASVPPRPSHNAVSASDQTQPGVIDGRASARSQRDADLPPEFFTGQDAHRPQE